MTEKQTRSPIRGLVAATHTPFDAQGALNLAAVEKQADHLLRNRVETVFIGGSTGESQSLTVVERLALAQRWLEASKGTPLRVIVHVGSNCLADSRTLAAQAQSLGALAISALAPSYFKPRDVDAWVACGAQIAAAAPGLPYYFYDIPALTNVHLSMPELLAVAAEHVPTLAGIKYTNPDLMAYQRCLRSHDGAFDVPWGLDECLLAALSLGASGAVGSTYNFAAPVSQTMLRSFEKGDLAAAREDQFRAVRLIHVLQGYGYLGAAKALMTMLGVDVGPVRLPLVALNAEQTARLRADLDRLGFFAWVR